MAPKRPINEFLSELDRLIRSGSGREAKLQLQDYPTRSLPREHRVLFCQLARRLRLNSLALRVLNPVVRPTSRKVVEATETERAEYAAALTAVGAVDEAIGIFKSLNPGNNPQIFFMEANAHFAKWNYSTAIPLLERYVNTKGLDSYWRLVGLANLAAAFVFERRPEANGILEELLSLSDPNQHRILRGYALELKAEKAVWSHDWPEARENLRFAEEFFRNSASIESLFIRKWLALVDLYEKGMQHAAPALKDVEKEAKARGHWETVRSLHYHKAIALQDPVLVARLLHGTPFESLRRNLRRDYVGAAPIPNECVWILGEEEKVPRSAIHSLESLCGERKGELKPGFALYRLFVALTLDSYRPIRIAEIHSNLFPGEYFNPTSSPHRIAQLINRLRGNLKKAKSPLRIEEKKGAYRLKSVTPLAILLGDKRTEVSSANSIRLEKLRETLGPQEFNLETAAKVLSLSTRSTSRVLLDATSEGIIVRLGKGKNTRYRCA